MRRYRCRTRRGVLLLVILALLAMFGLVAVAFVVVTGHEMRSSLAIQRIGQQETRPVGDLDQGILQALRGSTSPGSAMGPHGLLEDLYGNDPVGGTVGAAGDATAICGGQIIEFTATVAEPYRRVGCVLTMLEGPAAGRSTRIVGYIPQTNRFQILAFDGFETAALLNYLSQPGSPPCNYVVNGAPFSGTGFGFDPDTGNLQRKKNNVWEYALLPNPLGFPVNQAAPLYDPKYPDPAGLGGANEDYDAVDFQNMLLGAQIVDPTSGSVTTIPSLHRPALVNYWYHWLFNSAMLSSLPPEQRWYAILQPFGPDYLHPYGPDGQPGTPDDPPRDEQWLFDPAVADMIVSLKRKIILRPLPEDHPDFDGSNPSARLLNSPVFNPAKSQVNPYWERGDFGPWDVDNDGDGQPDGIWVDLGMPVRSTPDGRRYKPLFSFLCLDLDGRLNLNAHGCLAQAENSYYAPVDLANPFFAPPIGGPFVFAGGARPALPRGQGYGPAEINLLPLFSNPEAYSVLLTSRYQPLPALVAAAANNPDPFNLPGFARPDANQVWLFDPLSYNKWFEYGGAYWTLMPNGAGAYGAPPNPLGCGAIGLDRAGRPVYCRMGWNDPINKNDEKIDSPYKLNLSDQPAVDSLFTVSELERLLRPFDRDAGGLANRLALVTSTTGDPRNSVLLPHRHAITTESWDLPCPSVALPKALRDVFPGKRAGHVTDLLRAKGVPEAAWKDLLPPEILAGMRMDLNRLLGNGRDDVTVDTNNDGVPDSVNGVVDEPGEGVYPANPEQLTLYRRPGEPPVPVPFSYGADGSLADSLAARQLHARHLYVLLMLLVDTEGLQAQLKLMKMDDDVPRFLAQWAVNVVDFYDRDSIMTPFDYDPDPWNGWNPTARVWGCERPELLITETLAWHDRRTEDRDDEQFDGQGPEEEAGKVADIDPKKKDKDFDQKQRPRGALFVEVYNPWTAMESPPGELCYDRMQPNKPMIGVRLNQTTPNGQPVWRMIVVKPEEDRKNLGEQADPDAPLAADRPKIERSVYFVELPVGFDPPDDGQAYWPNMSAQFAPVMPGRYAVIGPGEPEPVGASYPTYVGDRVDPDPSNPKTLEQTRRIVLSPNPDPNLPQNKMQVEVLYNKPGMTVDIKRPVAVVINQPRRLSISEPTGGYDLKDPTGQPYNAASGEYDKPFDVPLDAASDLAAALLQTGTTTGVRMVHLQRLANPLLPWDATTNPYLTIDSMPVDLTAFNGVTSDPDPNDAGTVMFATRQRGERENEPPTTGVNNLWKQEPVDKAVVKSVGSTQNPHYFDYLLTHTLGYLNVPFGFRMSDPSGMYSGDPQQPFPWLTWNNRPYISQMELLLVPALRSSKLLVRNQTDEHKYFRFVKAGVNPRPYDPPAPPPALPGTNVAFPHLLNFFQSTGSDPPGNSPQLHRLLEYVHVPSRFAGTDLQGNPAVFAAAGGHSFHPPFNRVSRYREPGRINLNTIFSEKVFRGLINGYPYPGVDDGTFWPKFVTSRRGYGGADPFTLDSGFPTQFARPFRSFAGGEMVPLPGMKPLREVDITLLRSDPGDASRPLFRYEHAAAPGNSYPDDTDRNPYFRYQGLQRLGNLVTTRSNVYAVWITVGYFEVEPNPGGADAAHPDGYRLGSELGSETGDIQRHRAFCVFDRSIPVGFRRGQDLNVENAVLLRRFIE